MVVKHVPTLQLGREEGEEEEEEEKERRKERKGGRDEGRGGRQDIIEIHIVCSIIENVKRFELDNKASPSPLSSNFHPLPPWGSGVQ